MSPDQEAHVREILSGMDNAELTLQTYEERMLFASCMLVKTKELLDELLGQKGRRLMFDRYCSKS